MNLPEDRHPLLYVYLDNEPPERVRSRCLSQGAATLLGKWPEHLTFSWVMAIFGLVSLFTFFLLTVVCLVMSSSGHHHGKRALNAKCERNEHVVQLVHMKNLEELTVNENATYFVEIFTNESDPRDGACAVESYLKRTSLPVFLVSIFSDKSLENLTVCNRLESKFKNFKTITFDSNSFFNKTVFAGFQTQNPQNAKFLSFLAKVLVSWNVGGTVIGTEVKTLRNLDGVLTGDDKVLTVGTFRQDVVFISAKRFCHVYIFDVLKTITGTKDVIDNSQVDIVRMAEKRFCHGRSKCDSVRLVSGPEICDSSNATDGCTFLKSELGEPRPPALANLTWNNLCPLVKAFA